MTPLQRRIDRKYGKRLIGLCRYWLDIENVIRHLI